MIKDKFIFGTDKGINPKIFEYILENNIIVHTSFDYKGYEYIKKLEQSKINKIHYIFKFKFSCFDEFKKLYEKYKKDLNLKFIYAIQISRNPILSKQEQNLIFNFIEGEKKKKNLKKLYYEVYWQYSNDIIELLDNNLVDGYVFCYNPIEREVNNELFLKIVNTPKEIIALRTFSGFKINPDNKIFTNKSYLYYLFTKFYLFFLKKLVKKSYFDICKIFVCCNEKNISSIFTTLNYENFIKVYEIVDNQEKFKYLFKLIDYYHKICWSYFGSNSVSSRSFKIPLIVKIENKLKKFYRRITNN